MKKIILTLALVLVTSLSFANQTQENKSLEMNPHQDCFNYAIRNATEEAIFFGEYDVFAWVGNFVWYLNACEGAGGNIEDPVFIGG